MFQPIGLGLLETFVPVPDLSLENIPAIPVLEMFFSDMNIENHTDTGLQLLFISFGEKIKLCKRRKENYENVYCRRDEDEINYGEKIRKVVSAFICRSPE